MPVARLDRVWGVEGTLWGKHGDVSKNMSGIACEQAEGFPRDGLVIDDERQFAQLVRLTDGKIEAKDSIRLIEDTFGDHHLSLDGEGVAYSKGSFYVIGSHGYPRDPDHKLDRKRDAAEIAARIAASSQLVRISKANRSPTISRKLHELMRSTQGLQGHVDHRLDENGVSIEGVAILDDRLFAGFRSPLLRGDRAVILSVSLEVLFGDGPPDERKPSLLALGAGRGVRDLATWKDGLLVLAGPCRSGKRSDGKDQQYSVFWWDGSGEDTVLLGDLPAFHEKGEQTKPEAILPLEAKGAELRVLILFDGAEQGAPRSFFILNPHPHQSAGPG